MESNVLLNVLIFVLQYIVPWIFSATTVIIAILSFKHRRCRDVILWGFLPQFIMLGLFCGWLSQIGLGIAALIKTLAGLGGLIMLGTQVILLWAGERRGVVYLRLACLILGSVVFVLSLRTMAPQFFQATQGADLRMVAMKHLAQIDKDKEADVIHSIDDPAVLEEMLDIVASRPGMFSETVIRKLTNRVASPFYFSSDKAAKVNDKAPFFRAFESFNVAAIRVFCVSLTEPSPQAEKNRQHLRQDKTLLARTLKGKGDRASRRSDFITMSKMVLDIEPGMLNEDTWSAALNIENQDVIAFLWSYRAPESRENYILALAMQGKKEELAKGVRQTPLVLEQKTGPHSMLLSDLIYLVDPDVMQALVDTGVINWKHFDDDRGENRALDSAFDRAVREYGNRPPQPQILQIIVRGMVAQKAIPGEQTTRYLSLDEKGELSDALIDAGFSCQQQIAMANNVIARVPHLKFNTDRICGPGRQVRGDNTY